MFNQTENLIARMEHQHMQAMSASHLEGVEVTSVPGRLRRLLNALVNPRLATTDKVPEKTRQPSSTVVLHPEH